MTHRKKRRVSGSTTNTLLIVGGVGVAAFLIFQAMKPATPTTVVVNKPATGSSGTTAAEVAAGASVLTSIANDIFGDSNS